MEKDGRRGKGNSERVERAYSREKRARGFDLVWHSGGRDRDEVKKRKRRRNRGEGEINERDGESHYYRGYLREFATESLRVRCRCSHKQGAINLARKNAQYPSKAFAAMHR